MGLLRSLFGPSKGEIWEQLCHEVDGQFVGGGFFKGSKAILSHGGWDFTLDTFSSGNQNSRTTYTRLRAPYVNRDGFRFEVYREGLFSGICRLFGMQDIVVGVPQFDDDFVIKGNDKSKLRELFSKSALRRLVQAQPRIHLSVKDDEGWFGAHFPDGVDQLQFTCVGVITDIDRLRDLYDLFAVTLDHLCDMGSAYEDDPNVDL